MGSPSPPAAVALALCALLAFTSCDSGTPAARARTSEVASAAPTMVRQPSALHGCDPLTAEAPGVDEVTVDFGGAVDLRYRPRCLTIEVGDAVRFLGDFALHPMAGGAILEGAPVRDPRSPLPYANAGEEAVFRADRPGVYPYYCQVHWIVGMNGVIYVR